MYLLIGIYFDLNFSHFFKIGSYGGEEVGRVKTNVLRFTSYKSEGAPVFLMAVILFNHVGSCPVNFYGHSAATVFK